MSLAFMAIGLPGSGKSTVLRPFAQKHELVYINRDELREHFAGGDPSRLRSVSPEVLARSNELMEEALRAGNSLLIDATFPEIGHRRTTIALMREAGATRVVGIYADIPFETACANNNSRARVVPQHAMDNMHSQLTAHPPSLEDGFDEMYHLDELDELERKEFGQFN